MGRNEGWGLQRDRLIDSEWSNESFLYTRPFRQHLRELKTELFDAREALLMPLALFIYVLGSVVFPATVNKLDFHEVVVSGLTTPTLSPSETLTPQPFVVGIPTPTRTPKPKK